MKREIKFRAWDGFKIRYLNLYQCENYSEDFVLRSDNSEYWIDDNCGSVKDIMMQYTGLRDDNDVEIYEGDIVRFSGWDDKNPLNLIIFWDDTEYAWGASKSLNLFHVTQGSRNSIFCLFKEVIGNIHENPELL